MWQRPLTELFRSVWNSLVNYQLLFFYHAIAHKSSFSEATRSLLRHFFEFPRWSLTRASTVVEVQGNSGMSSQFKFQFTFIYLFNYLTSITSRLYFAFVRLSPTQILTSLWIELGLFKRKAWDGNFPRSPGPRWSGCWRGSPKEEGCTHWKIKMKTKPNE